MTTTDAEQKTALEFARSLISLGIPVFLARPALDVNGKWDPTGGTGSSGYWLPGNWQHTRPDPAVLDAWQAGFGLAAVGGHALAFVDVDPRNGGEASRATLGDLPSYATVSTPSGGTHEYVATLGVPSRDKVLPGLDVKDGEPDGNGRGFVWLPGTQKVSKVTGAIACYEVIDSTRLVELAEALDVWERLDADKPALQELRSAVAASRRKEGPTVDPAEAAQILPYEIFNADAKTLSEAVGHIKARLEELERAEPGGVWDALRAAAYAIGGYVPAIWNGNLETAEQVLRRSLAVAAPNPPDRRAPGWWDETRVIRECLRDGAAKPYQVMENPPDPKADEATPPTDDRPFLDRLRARCVRLDEPYQALPRRDWWTTVSGVPLLHESALVLVYGDPGSMKSMLAQHVALTAARAGAKVLYADFENARSTQGRIQGMAGGKEVPDSMYLLPMEEMPTEEFVGELIGERFDLVIVDSATYLSALDGGNGDDAGSWVRACLRLLNPLRRSGATVMVVDHLPKAAEGRAGSPAGSVQKRGQADQMFLLKADPARYGVVTIARSKDREGEITTDLQIAELEPFMEMRVARNELTSGLSVNFRDLDAEDRIDPKLKRNEELMMEAYRELQVSFVLDDDKSLSLKTVYEKAGLTRQQGRTAWDRLVRRGQVPKLMAGTAQAASVVLDA